MTTQGTSVNASITYKYVLAEGVSIHTQVVVLLALCVLGISGNSMALFILYIRPIQDRSTAFYHLVKVLAVFDLAGVLIATPVPLLIGGDVVEEAGMAMCHFLAFSLVMTANSTLDIVLVMTVERFLLTKFPFQYHILVTKRNLNVTIITLWLLSAIFTALPIMGVGKNSVRYPGIWCFFDYRDTSIGSYLVNTSYAVGCLSVIAVTFVLNTVVILHLWRMYKARHRISIAPARRCLGTEMKIILFLMTVISVFTVCYSPFMVRMLINQYQNTGGVEAGGLEDQRDILALRMAIWNQVVDPWIYIISRIAFFSDGNQSTTVTAQSRATSNTFTSAPEAMARSLTTELPESMVSPRLARGRKVDKVEFPRPVGRGSVVEKVADVVIVLEEVEEADCERETKNEAVLSL